MTRDEVCANRYLQDLPLRIETNRWGLYPANKGRSSFRHAPEICVEVKSPSNTTGELLEKKPLYFKAGAWEVWIWEQSGRMLFFDAASPLERSALCPDFPATV